MVIRDGAEENKIESLAMPLLGTSYGKLKERGIMQLLQDSLIQNRQEHLKKYSYIKYLPNFQPDNHKQETNLNHLPLVVYKITIISSLN